MDASERMKEKARFFCRKPVYERTKSGEGAFWGNGDGAELLDGGKIKNFEKPATKTQNNAVL